MKFPAAPARILAGITPRQRRMLALAGGALAVGLVGSLAVWVMAEHARLVRKLPVARAQLARMQENVDELTRLRGNPALPRINLATRAEIARAAALAHQLNLVVETTGDSLHVTGQAPATALLDWLATLQRQQLRVNRMELRSMGSLLNVDGRLDAPGNE